MAFQCFDDPAAILEKAFCVTQTSKDLRGELKLASSKGRKCKEPECKTLRTAHSLKVSVVKTVCDTELGHFLDGSLAAKLSTAFDTDGTHRGFHSGEFSWTGQAGLTIKGRMSGITNSGTHRKPIKDCQTCRDRGIMEGKLCGEVVEAGHTRLKGCQVFAAYRIKFEPSEKGGEGAIVGTIEGVVVCFCTA